MPILEGLRLLKDFLTVQEEENLVREIDAREWAGHGISPNPELRRRTQQYGGVFSYRYRRVMNEAAPTVPHFVDFILERLLSQGILTKLDMPNSVIINEYEVGQGIMPHIDATTIFGTHILSLSLLSDCAMYFTKPNTDTERVGVHLPRLSLLVLSGDSRYNWHHSISKDAIDIVDGKEIVRGRRVSLTFRQFSANSDVTE